MKLPNTRIELACAKRNARQYLTAPYLDAEHKRLVASNDYIMAVLPVEIDGGDTSGHVPLEAIAHARKVKCFDLQANSAIVVDGVQFPRPDLGPYPPYEKVIPERPNREPDITLDAQLLYDLARAICDGKSLGVSLWIDGPDKVVRVEPRAGGENFGLIMPMRR